jgi:hypothetical protein
LRRCVQAPLDLGIARYQRFTERHQFGTATAFATVTVSVGARPMPQLSASGKRSTLLGHAELTHRRIDGACLDNLKEQIDSVWRERNALADVNAGPSQNCS